MSDNKNLDAGVKKPEQELVEARLKKLEALKEKNINPYPYRFEKKFTASQVLNADLGLKVKTAGRVVALRRLGGSAFGHLQDFTGKVQFMMRRDVTNNYELLKLLDLGDFIGVEGEVFKTKAGEKTILVKHWQFLAKALKPLPEKFHGLRDPELKYRKRYLDFITNPESVERFLKRFEIINAFREFLTKKGFVEFETPVLQPVYGGASARPFKTFLHDLKMDVYLRISLELYLKRLIIGGFDKVFEIGKNFRNEGIDRTHNPEFTMMECYQAYADYNDMMRLTEELISFVAKKVVGKARIEYQGRVIDLTPPWKRLTMAQGLKQEGIDVESISDEKLKKLLKQQGIEVQPFVRGKAIAELFEKLVQPKLIQPTFVMDYPLQTTPLCKQHRANPLLIERFEPVIAGIEVGNAYSELNDPLMQEKLLKQQALMLKRGDETANPYDKDFVEALMQGMPPCGGLGIGIDRVVMLLTNAPSIRDVIAFPFMKPD